VLCTVSVRRNGPLILLARGLDLSGTDNDRPSEGHELPAQAAAPVILVVEDDFLIAADVESSLRSAGFDVCGVATSADEAVSLARIHRPALAIMDIRLVGKRDGIDAALELRRELGLRCIFVSAHADEDTRRRAEPAEPLGWMPKPYTMSSLIQLVAKSLILLRDSQARSNG
jgi:DNA-binding NarL/FixJ family response regulator